MLVKKVLLFALLLFWFAYNCFAIIVRDDRKDEKYLEFGKQFPAVGLILPREGVATLIAPRWALTAAHVAKNLSSNSTISFGGDEYPIQKKVIYPGWKEEGPGDLALLYLSKTVKGVEPLSIYADQKEAGSVIAFVGYGGTGTGVTGRDHEDGKKRAATNQVDRADQDWLYFTFDPPSSATDLEGISGPGDSGGPALIKIKERWQIAGISVWGDSGGKKPGSYGQKEGYTRVSSHAQWISSTLKERESDEEIGGERLPETPAGKIVASYIEAYQAGEEAMDLFQQQHFSKETLQKRSKEQRMETFRNIKKDIGSIEFKQVLSNSPNAISILAKSEKGEWLEFSFEFAADQKIGGIRLEQSNGPAEITPAQSLTQDQLVPSLNAYLEDLVKKDQFSGVVSLVKDGTSIYEKAFGLASKRYAVPNRVDTKFNIGSINKIFTAIAITQLATAHKLSLDDTVDRYLPDFPADKAKQITIRQLLTHRSGLGDFFGEKYLSIAKDRLQSNNDYIPLFRDNPLQFAPGSDQSYSNAGYVLLGAIIEKVSGEDYYDYIRKHVTAPAGMNDTESYRMDADVLNLATGYTHHAEDDSPDTPDWHNNTSMHGMRASAAGGGYSTAQDLLKFAKAIQAGTLPLPEHDGPPLAKGELPGLGYAGGAPGLNGLLETFSRGGYVLVVLSNYDPPTAETIGKKVRAWIQNLKDTQ
jgi:CubicO group peptidase (beta-lactamase class C family)